MKHRSKLLGGLALAASTSLIAFATVPAHAEPVRPYAATGSDTIQDVWNTLTNGSGLASPAIAAVAPSISSWNAFDAVPYTTGSTTSIINGAYPIQTKEGGAWYVRPSGSGEGIKSLSTVWNPDPTKAQKWTKAPSLPTGAYATTPATCTAAPGATDPAGTSPTCTVTQGTSTYSTTAVVSVLNHQDVDFARSSSGPGTTGSDLTFIPFARDAVSLAYNPGTTPSLTTSLNLTFAQVKELYTGVKDCTDTVVTFDTVTCSGGVASGTVTASTKVFIQATGMASAAQVFPFIPQNGSGTRKFFLKAVTGSQTPALPPYIANNNASTAQGGLAENDGSVLASTPGALIPFSAAQWIAQNNGAPGVNNTTTGLAISSIDGKTAVNGTAPSLTPGALYGTQTAGTFADVPQSTDTFARDTYDVVPSLFLGSSATGKQTGLISILNGGSAGQLGSGAAKTVIKKYGFGVLGYITAGGADPGTGAPPYLTSAYTN